MEQCRNRNSMRRNAATRFGLLVVVISPRSNAVAGDVFFEFITIVSLWRPTSRFHSTAAYSIVCHQTSHLDLHRRALHHGFTVFTSWNCVIRRLQTRIRFTNSTIQRFNRRVLRKKDKQRQKNGSEMYQIDALMVNRCELSSSSYASIRFLLFFFFGFLCVNSDDEYWIVYVCVMQWAIAPVLRGCSVNSFNAGSTPLMRNRNLWCEIWSSVGWCM